MFTFIYFAIVVLCILTSILLYAIDVFDDDGMMCAAIALSLIWIVIIPIIIIVFAFYGFYLLCVKYKYKIRKILRIKDKK